MRHVRVSAQAPPCDPATLGPICAGGCGRRLHTDRRRDQPRRKCGAGHPVHERNRCCSACAKTSAPTVAVCVCDEDDCDCTTTWRAP